VLLHGNFSSLGSAVDQKLKDSASLVVCTWKIFFGWGLRIFYEWHHKWRTFRPPWPTSPGPGPKPL